MYTKKYVEEHKYDLVNANLAGANLSGAYLRSANLANVDLAGAYLRYANLWSAGLAGANLKGANLGGARLRDADLEGANLSDANLRDVDLAGADLEGANLQGANLRDTDLEGADLENADLKGADLVYADLSCANLEGATISSPLHHLKELPPDTVLRCWKYLSGNGLSPYYRTRYEVGKTYEFTCNTDERVLCAKGGNVATLEWCLGDDIDSTNQFIEVEFQVKDIGAIPYATDGKFRVKKFKILRQISREEALKLSGEGDE